MTERERSAVVWTQVNLDALPKAGVGNYGRWDIAPIDKNGGMAPFRVTV